MWSSNHLCTFSGYYRPIGTTPSWIGCQASTRHRCSSHIVPAQTCYPATQFSTQFGLNHHIIRKSRISSRHKRHQCRRANTALSHQWELLSLLHSTVFFALSFAVSQVTIPIVAIVNLLFSPNQHSLTKTLRRILPKNQTVSSITKQKLTKSGNFFHLYLPGHGNLQIQAWHVREFHQRPYRAPITHDKKTPTC